MQLHLHQLLTIHVAHWVPMKTSSLHQHICVQVTITRTCISTAPASTTPAALADGTDNARTVTACQTCMLTAIHKVTRWLANEIVYGCSRM